MDNVNTEGGDVNTEGGDVNNVNVVDDDMDNNTLADPGLNMDQISTMTLSEFKQLISHSLSVPPPGVNNGTTDPAAASDPGSAMKRSRSVDGQNLSWSSVKDKARSVANSLATSASSRRTSASGSSAGNIIARRNLPRTPADHARSRTPTGIGGERPKTPTAIGAEGPKTPSSYRSKTPTAIGGERPKTPTSIGGERPKTPVQYRHITSAYAYRTKTPTTGQNNNSHPQRSQTPTRPKTPTSISAPRASNATSRPGAGERGRPRTPQDRRPKTPPGQPNPRVQSTSIVSTADCVTSNPRVKSSSFVYSDDGDNCVENCADTYSRTSAGMGLRSASLASSMDMDDGSVSLSLPQSRRSQSPLDDLDLDVNSEIAEAMDGRSSSMSSVSVRDVRERPSTPSRIPKPSFAARPPTPTTPLDSRTPGSEETRTPGARGPHRTLPRPSTPVGRSSGEATATSQASRKLSLQNAQNSSRTYTELYHARRAHTPGPVSTASTSSSSVSASRSSTPGPGNSTGDPTNSTAARRSSLARTADMARLRKAKSVTNLLSGDSGKISAVDIDMGEQGSSSRRNSSSVTPRRSTDFSSQQRGGGGRRSVGGEVVMVSRTRGGQHSVQVTDRDRNVAYTTGVRGRLPPSSGDKDANQPRSKTPGPGVGTRYQPRSIIRKPAQKGPGAQSKPLTRTEAWVDSTLHDPKRKQPLTRTRRPMTPNSLSVADSELLSRPLEEIQAALPSPCEGVAPPDPKAIEAPPEDPEMYRKMEQLFEKYREMELRASVCDTPGGGNDASGGGGRRGSVGGQGQVTGQGQCAQSTSSRSSSVRGAGVATSISFSSGISSGMSLHTESSQGKETSTAAAAAHPVYNNGAASNNDGHHDHYSDLNATDDSACVFGESRGAPAVSADDIMDVDEETLTSNPTALVSKIKEILQVRPRKEEAGSKSRIPAPAFLSRNRRSKSVSNIATESSFSLAESSTVSAPREAVNGVGCDESTNSDVSSEYSRCETPVPKLARPLTTGRSILFHREKSVGSRSISQEEGVSSSTSSSSSRRYFWDEDGEFV